MSDTIRAEMHFAQIPEWVLYSNITPQAIRLYCVLHRYASKGATNTAYPSRRTLAEHLHVIDRKVVDRALKELVGIGAISVKGQVRTGTKEQTSNLYTVVFAAQKEVGVETPQPGGPNAPTPGVETPHQEPESFEPEPEEPEKPLPAKSAGEGEFEKFWGLYPRRKDKGHARKAFESALKKAPLEEILDGLKRSLSDFSLRPADKIPYPATWLNGEGWLDEKDSPAAGPGEWREATDEERAIIRELQANPQPAQEFRPLPDEQREAMFGKRVS